MFTYYHGLTGCYPGHVATKSFHLYVLIIVFERLLVGWSYNCLTLICVLPTIEVDFCNVFCTYGLISFTVKNIHLYLVVAAIHYRPACSAHLLQSLDLTLISGQMQSCLTVLSHLVTPCIVHRRSLIHRRF